MYTFVINKITMQPFHHYKDDIVKYAAAIIAFYFLILSLVLVSGFLSQFAWLFSAFIQGIIIALIVKPIIDIFTQASINHRVSMLLGYTIFFTIILAIVFLILPPLIDELNMFLGPGIKQIQLNYASLDPLNSFLRQFNSSASISIDQITAPITQNLGSVLSNIGSIATNLVGIVIQFILGLIFSIFLISDGKKLFKQVLKITPKEFKKDYVISIDALMNGFKSFIKIQGISALIYALIIALLLKLFGFDYILLITVLSFLAFLIPGIGGVFALIPPLLLGILFKNNEPLTILFLMLFIFAIQNIILNVIVPKFYGKKLGIHPALVLIVILVSLQVLGIMGVIIAIPIASAIQQIINHNFAQDKMQKASL